MAAYFVANVQVNDVKVLQEYIAEVTDLLAEQPIEVLVADNEVEVLEGTPAGNRLVIIKWASKEAFRAFYHSPAYQKTVQKRFASTDGFAVLVDGLERPAAT